MCPERFMSQYVSCPRQLAEHRYKKRVGTQSSHLPNTTKHKLDIAQSQIGNYNVNQNEIQPKQTQCYKNDLLVSLNNKDETKN